MNRPVMPFIGFLLLPMGCGDPTGPVLQPSELCSTHGSAIATFEDPNLEAAVRGELVFLGHDPQSDLTCAMLSSLRNLSAPSASIVSLVGIQNLGSGGALTAGVESLDFTQNLITDLSPLSGLTDLTELALWGNSISDISALSGLTSLEILWLDDNTISDISALSGLTSLRHIGLERNSITDISALRGLTSLTSIGLGFNADLTNIQPLLDNTGLGAGDDLNLRFTNVSCTDVAALEAKGVAVLSFCS